MLNGNQKINEARNIEVVRKELDEVIEEINKQYWFFTRSARGKPVDPKLCKKREELQEELQNLNSQGDCNENR